MNSSRNTMAALAIVVVALLVASSVVVVKETETAVKLRFGALKEDNLAAGLHFKVPMMDEIRKFDARVLTLDAEPESFFTSENKRLIVDSYAKWRIVDSARYYKSASGLENTANDRLSTRINDGLRNAFGKRTLIEVVSGERDELMAVITKRVDDRVRKELGVQVLDVRIKRIDLPEETSGSVFSRMAADREKEAREHRSQGQEQAEKIRADADRQRTIIHAEAYSESEKIRGAGDAKAAAIYASAYNQDPEFYTFVRSLNAYQKSFSNKDDVMVVDPQSDFFRYLNDTSGTLKKRGKR